MRHPLGPVKNSGDEENSQGETGNGSDGQEGNPSHGCSDN